jgi:hypothetical protein
VEEASAFRYGTTFKPRRQKNPNVVCWQCGQISLKALRCPEKQTDISTVNVLTGKVRADVCIIVELDGRQVSVLLDSGCEPSVINSRFVQPRAVQPMTLELFTASSEKLSIMGEVNVDMLIGKSKLRHKMVASSAIAEVILEIDLLKEFKCSDQH